MYNIYADGVLIHHSQSPDSTVKVIEPKLKRADNAAGSLTFKIAPSNPGYETIKRLSTEIVVKRVEKSGEKELWSGRVIDETKDFWNNRSLTCEGELGYLNDTSQPPAEYHNITVRDFLGTLLNIHNKKNLSGNGVPISIKFNENTRTESVTYDYIEIYYPDGTGTYSKIKLGGSIGARTITIPTSDFYLYWFTDHSQHDYYGFKIDEIVPYTGSSYTTPTNTKQSLPSYTPVERTLDNLPESEHSPYQDNVRELYYVNTGFGVKHTFQLGIVTVTDNNATGEDSLYRYTNFESTLDCIIDKMVKRLGGHLRIRKENGVRYLDYLKDYFDNNQTIEFGKNLIDFTRNWDVKELATVVVPLGCNVSELGLESSIPALEEYLTVKDVNDNSIYVKSDAAIEEFGWIETIVHWDDVTQPSNLLRKAKEYLEVVQFEEMVLELSAVDMHYFDIDEQALDMLDIIHCISAPHGMDRTFPITEIDIPLDRPDDTTFTLGDTERSTRGISASIRDTNSTIFNTINQLPSTTSVLNKAKAETTDLLNMYTNGFINIVVDEDEEYGMHSENLIISNKQDWYDYKNTDRYDIKFWQWNVNGLAFYDYTDRTNTSKDDALALRQALTMDGTIVADRILTGQLGKREWGNYWNMETGEFHLGLSAYVGTGTDASSRIATTGNVSTAQTNAINSAKSYTDDLNNSLDQEEVFNRLTKNGKAQGMAKVYNYSTGAYDLYINASYINTGYLSASRISGGIISGNSGTGMTINLNTGVISTNSLEVTSTYFKLTSTGVLTATGASINGSIVSEAISYGYGGIPLKVEIIRGQEVIYANNQKVIEFENSYTGSTTNGAIILYRNGSEKIKISGGNLGSYIQAYNGDLDIYAASYGSIRIYGEGGTYMQINRAHTSIEICASSNLILSASGVVEVNCPDDKFLYNGKRVRTYSS